MERIKLEGVKPARGSPHSWTFTISGAEMCLMYRKLAKCSIYADDLKNHSDLANAEIAALLKLIQNIQEKILEGGINQKKRKYLQAEIKLLNDTSFKTSVNDSGIGFYFVFANPVNFDLKVDFGFTAEWGANDAKTENILCEIATLIHEFAQEKERKTTGKVVRLVQRKTSRKISEQVGIA